jgi:hypothetical protein
MKTVVCHVKEGCMSMSMSMSIRLVWLQQSM